MPQRSRAQRLNGLFPLSYTGVVPVSPVNFVMDTRNPTINDSKNFYLGDLWLNTASLPSVPPKTSDLWMLVSLVGNNATWVNFASGISALQSLTGNNVGNPVFVDGADNINVVGDGTTITIIGNPGTHTLTASVIGTGVLSSLTGDNFVPVFPLAGNTNIFGTAGNITVLGNAGTHTLTIDTGGNIASSFITNPATGTAVPVAGVLTFAGTGDVTVSAAGSTVTINGSGSGTVTGLLAQDGHTVTPTAGVIQVSGSGNLSTTGTIGPNTLTVNYAPTSSFAANFNAETNITGDGTVAHLGATVAATVSSNIGGNFNPGNGAGTGSSYTAPVTGLYYFYFYCAYSVTVSATNGVDFSLGLTGALAINLGILPTSNSCVGFANNSGFINVGGSASARLNVGDVVTFTIQSNGGGKNLSTIQGQVGGYRIA